MSSRKFGSYESRREMGSRNYYEARQDRPSSSSSHKRDVFPQFSEPDEYMFKGFPQGQSSCPPPVSFNPHLPPVVVVGQETPPPPPGGPLPPGYRGGPTGGGNIGLWTGFPSASALRQSPLPAFHRTGPPALLEDLEGNTGGDLRSARQSFQQSSGSISSLVEEVAGDSPKEPPGNRFRLLTGTVDHVKRWHKMSKNSELSINFEVAGTLESTINKGCMQLLILRSEAGCVLQTVFYSIDRELAPHPPGTLLLVTGRMIGSYKMHLFKAVKISTDELLGVQRLAFLSQRALEKSLDSID